MTIRQHIRRKAASAAAAFAVSAFFIGVTIAPVSVQTADTPAAQIIA